MIIAEIKLGSGTQVLFIPIRDYVVKSFDQNVARLTQSPEGQRDSQAGLIKATWASMHSGGAQPKNSLGSWARDLDKFGFNEGVATRNPFIGTLPYLLQVQSQISGGFDVSGFITANKRAHAVNWPSASGFRWMAGLGQALVRDVSVSDHNLEVAGASGLGAADIHAANVGDSVTGAGARSTTLFFGLRRTGANAGAVFGTTDPTAATPTWTRYDAQGAAVTSRCYGICYIPTLDISIFYGVFQNPTTGLQTGLCYCPASSMRSDLAGQADITAFQPVGLSRTLLGGSFYGSSPANALVVGIIMPVGADEETTITRGRQVGHLTMTSQTTGTWTPINSDLDTVVDADWFLGGDIIAGGSSNTLGTRLVLVDSSGTIRDTNFPGLNGSTQYFIRGVKGAGRYARVTVSKSDGTDSQIWSWDSALGKWHYDSALLTKADTPGGLPLSFSTKVIGAQQRREYLFTPDGGNSALLNVYRQFVPPDPAANQMLTNVTEKFHYGTLKIRSIQLDIFGPTESNKVVNRLLYGNRFASAVGGSYGTIDFSLATDGNVGTFTPVETNTFDNAFEEYNVPSGGRKFKTLVAEWAITNGSTNEGNAETNTPSIFPMTLEGVGKWPKIEEIVAIPDMPGVLDRNSFKDIMDFSSKLQAYENVASDLSGGKPVFEFTLLSRNGLVTVEAYTLRPIESDQQSQIVFRTLFGAVP